MSYRKYSVPQYDSKTGFDKAAPDYRSYRTHLNSVDNNRFLRFLPRSLQGLTIADIGAGDGRIFDQLKNSGWNEYIALDISQHMLDRLRASNVKKICSDCSEEIPLESESVDLALAFFVFEYIETLSQFFEEVYRILKPGGTFVATYFYQRNAFVRGHGDDAFKISRESHIYADIEKAAKNTFFTIEAVPIIDQYKTLGYIYVFEK